MNFCSNFLEIEVFLCDQICTYLHDSVFVKMQLQQVSALVAVTALRSALTNGPAYWIKKFHPPNLFSKIRPPFEGPQPRPQIQSLNKNICCIS